MTCLGLRKQTYADADAVIELIKHTNKDAIASWCHDKVSALSVVLQTVQSRVTLMAADGKLK